MKRMLHWHRDAFDVFPIGEGYELDVNEFDFMDDGGVCYEKNGVTITHWRQSHAKDGASACRLDWNGLSMDWTGDGRPNSLTEKNAAGYLYNQVNPRLAMATHVLNDEHVNADTIVELREHWKFPFHFGFDLVVANITKDKVWGRQGIVSDFPNSTRRSLICLLAICTCHCHVIGEKKFRSNSFGKPRLRWKNIIPKRITPFFVINGQSTATFKPL